MFLLVPTFLIFSFAEDFPPPLDFWNEQIFTNTNWPFLSYKGRSPASRQWHQARFGHHSRQRGAGPPKASHVQPRRGSRWVGVFYALFRDWVLQFPLWFRQHLSLHLQGWNAMVGSIRLLKNQLCLVILSFVGATRRRRWWMTLTAERVMVLSTWYCV